MKINKNNNHDHHHNENTNENNNNQFVVLVAVLIQDNKNNIHIFIAPYAYSRNLRVTADQCECYSSATVNRKSCLSVRLSYSDITSKVETVILYTCHQTFFTTWKWHDIAY